jgi:hypothetical protein
MVLAVFCGVAVGGAHTARPDQPLREERHVPKAEAPDTARDPGADGGSPPTAAAPPVVIRPGGEVVTPPVTVGSVPATAFAAYRQAADWLARAQPGCHLTVPLLAAIGKVESGHARGGVVDAAGTTLRPILGPTLDGSPGLATIADTDGGRWDGDGTWDRAVGPMQFIPGTWARWARDANGDGVADPHNVYDAALTAGRYLCADNRDLATEDGRRAAVLSYNNSAAYLRIVLTWLSVYDRATVVAPNGSPMPHLPQEQVALPAPTQPGVPTTTPPAAGPTPPAPTVPPAPSTPSTPSTVPPAGTTPPIVVADPLTGIVCLVGGVVDVAGGLLGGLLGTPATPVSGEECTP